MKISSTTLLFLTFLESSRAFSTGPAFSKGVKKSHGVGKLHGWFSDRFGNNEIEDTEPATPEEEEAWWEVKEDGIFGFVPTKEMTGVEPHMTQLCSTFSSQLYNKLSFDEFKLSTKDHKTELLIFDDHGDFKVATPPFGVAVCGETMIIGWRGYVFL